MSASLRAMVAVSETRWGYGIVVPDEDLYEQGAWPSLFNRTILQLFASTNPIPGLPYLMIWGGLFCATDVRSFLWSIRTRGTTIPLKRGWVGKQGKFFMRLNRSIIKRLKPGKQKFLSKLGISPQF
ncbi:MAG: hypothetical protein CM1200mP16_07780 [Nitrospina sp.]|nr:MAG: hypothetical protein CM1200mP16_07780 [Nitrospina sp.]